MAQLVMNPPATWETWVWSWVGKIPWRTVCHPLQYSCLENPHGQRSLAGYSPWGCKEPDTTELLTLSLFINLEKNSWKNSSKKFLRKDQVILVENKLVFVRGLRWGEGMTINGWNEGAFRDGLFCVMILVAFSWICIYVEILELFSRKKVLL